MTVLARTRLMKLFEYIGEQLKDVNPAGFNISHPPGFCFTPADSAGLLGVEMDIKVEGDHIWLRVPRLETTQPPSAPEQFATFFIVNENPFASPPSLNEVAILQKISVLNTESDSAQQHHVDKFRAELEQSLSEYTKLWKAWSEEEKLRIKTIDLYGNLFALRYQMGVEETVKPMELVWGVGVAVWRLVSKGKNFDFKYPLLTQAVEILIDEKSMAIEIRPRTTSTRIEFDAFINCSVRGAADVEKEIRAYLLRHTDHPVTPFDSGSYNGILKLIATNIDDKGVYQEILSTTNILPPAEANLVVTDSWVILSRPRPNNYLIEDLHRLQEKLQDGCDIPEGPLALVSPPSDKPIAFETITFRGLSSRNNSNTQKSPEELYFPLPYNEEQVTIIQRLERAAGVAVQGPPGTGKTHTIANIICHYLANGKRVLVTSRGEHALSVLQEKIPEDIRLLTVGLLTNDREGIRQFQASIESIQHQVSQLNPEVTLRDIETLKQSINRVHAEIGQIDRRIDQIALTQLAEVEVDGLLMQAEKMAELVVSGSAQYAWFDDALSLGDEHKVKWSEEEISELRNARRKLGKDLIYVNATIPCPDILFSVKDIAKLHNMLCRIKSLEHEEQNGNLRPLRAVTVEILQEVRELLEVVNEAKSIMENLELVNEEWPMTLRKKCKEPIFEAECQALEALFEEIDYLAIARADFIKRAIELPESILGDSKTKEAINRAVETGKPLSFFSFPAKKTKEHIAAIKIAGLSPSSKEDWVHIQRYLNLNEKIISFIARWNQFAETLSMPILQGNVFSLREIEIIILIAKQAYRLGTEFDNKIYFQSEAILERPLENRIFENSTVLSHFRQNLIQHLTRSELAQATIQFRMLQEKLIGCTGPVSEEFDKFVCEKLGNIDLDETKIITHYVELIGELRRINSLSIELAIVRDFAKRVEENGAPKFSHRILTIPVDANGVDTVLLADWRKAWNWARMKSYLNSIEARDELLNISSRRQDLEGELAKLYREMVAKTAWLATKRNASPKVLQALAGYATAIRRIGQGTGPNAVRYRRDARTSMFDAASAVPCWIMSHAKISESMPADIGSFDLVIVDEASQSDLWALPAIVRGKKILVVGDAKQVSPDGGFISSQHIEELKHRFLADQPYATEMTPEKSLYDLAARVFAAEQVMLREHFRCVPAIIAYSNREFYQGAIQPLRIPKPSERIDPPLVDIYVENGYRDASDINRGEAEVIANEICTLLKNKRFFNSSIGVVSLLGIEQARYIDKLVRQSCALAELNDTDIECGDARTFQGREKDILFLSLVVDPSNCKAVSGNLFEQRFNVGASRARDRMYLIRSVTTAHLSEKDLRLSLLNHFNNPLVSDAQEATAFIDRCESEFERDVYSKLTKHGYRVIPQVKTGAYRIDMVVEGANDSRLAVECDGDQFHGPDKWAQDMLRQRVLERVGWTFWRCFASTWSLHKEEVFAELVERLTLMGIEPLGALDYAPSLVEKRILTVKHEEIEVHK